MLFTYQKKTQKIITTQTTDLPSFQEKENVQLNVNYINTNNTFIPSLFIQNEQHQRNWNNNMFYRVEKTSKCSSCNH
jgi:capsular polysaccharide biosynthesis protein